MKNKKTNIVIIAVLTFSVIFMTYLGVNTEDIKQIKKYEKNKSLP